MEARKRAIEKIVMSRRRTLTASDLVEKTKLCSVALLQLQRKHLQALQQLHILHTVKISFASEKLSYNKKEKKNTFWETNCQVAEEPMFRNQFRMSRTHFNKLCQLLPGLQQSFTNMSKTITLQKGIAIALYTLGSTEAYHKIGKLFGVNEATVMTITLRFCEEVWKILAPMYLNNFPLTKERVETLVDEFEALGFPQCIGALGSCHITLRSTNLGAMGTSVVLLSLVDARCRFIYVNCGSSGHCTNSQIYKESSLKQYLDKCCLLSELQKNISDVDVPVLITGDSTFQLSENLMTPYASQTIKTQQQKLFNHVLSKSIKLAEKTFLQLKARFKRFEKGFDTTIRNSNAIILSCCVLHNFLNENSDSVNENWLQTLQTSKELKRLHAENNIMPTDANNAKAIRLAIASYISGKDVSDDESQDLIEKGESGGFTRVGDAAGDLSMDANDEEVFIDDDNGSILIEELMSE